LTRSPKVVKRPDHKFYYEMMQKGLMPLPDDPEENVFLKIWLFQSWSEEQDVHKKSLRNQAILIGSFTNPEAARKLAKKDDPDYDAGEEGFQGAWGEVIKSRQREMGGLARRPRRSRRRQVVSA